MNFEDRVRGGVRNLMPKRQCFHFFLNFFLFPPIKPIQPLKKLHSVNAYLTSGGGKHYFQKGGMIFKKIYTPDLISLYPVPSLHSHAH